MKPNILVPFDRKRKQDLHCISYLVLNVLSMYQTWHVPLFHPNRNPNTFLSNKFKILFKILHKYLIEQKQVKQAPGSFLFFWFSVTYIKISSKPWPINLCSKMLKRVRKVTYFVPFCSLLKRTLLKFNLILQRCMVLLRSPTSLLHICRGRYLR